nr:hypothetical protein [Actinomadura madurae]
MWIRARGRAPRRALAPSYTFSASAISSGNASVARWERISPAAGRQRVPVAGDQGAGVVLVGHEMQDRHQQQRDRLGEVDQVADGGVAEDVVRAPKVRRHEPDVAGPREKGAAVRAHDGVVVDVHDPGVRAGERRRLVHVLPGRQPRPEVEELADPGRGGVPHRPAEEGPVQPDAPDDPPRGDLHDALGGLPVGGEVVLAAEPVVVHPGHVGGAGVECRGDPVRGVGHRVMIGHRPSRGNRPRFHCGE